MRVTSLTMGVLAGEHPSKLMQRAGHRSFETTKGYIDLAGVVAHQDADALATFMLEQKREEESAEDAS
jgi:ferritin